MAETSQATQAAVPQSAEWWKDQNFIKTLFSSLKSISDPNTSTTIGPDGTITTKTKIAGQQPGQPGQPGTVTPQQAAQAMSAVPQSSGPTIPQGVFDPNIMNQLLAGQQHSQQYAAQLPQILSDIGYKGALTEQAGGWREREQQELVKTLANQFLSGQFGMAEREMADSGAMARHLAPSPWREGEKDILETHARAAMLNAQKERQPTGLLTENQALKLKESKLKDSNNMARSIMDSSVTSDKPMDIELFNNSVGDGEGSLAFAMDVGTFKDSPVKIDLGNRMLNEVRMIAKMGRMSTNDYLSQAYAKSKELKIPVRDVIENSILKAQERIKSGEYTE